MPRQNRKQSSTKIHNVIMRGNNKQLLFEEPEDYEYFLTRLNNYIHECNCEIYAYCLMDNHVHMIVKEGPDGISKFMQRLANSYVYWFNNKYKRSGHLFQGRFKSEPIETERYFLAAVRYIHNNPVKAGIVKQCQDYEYSSYNEYIHHGGMTMTKLCLSILGNKSFKEFHSQSDNGSFLEPDTNATWYPTDSAAIQYIRSILDPLPISSLLSMPVKIRNSHIKLFREFGMSIKQISRLTGISTVVVHHAS